MSELTPTSPALGAVALVAALAGAVGLTLANAILSLPLSLTWRHIPVVALVVVAQGLAWWWTRRRQRAIARALVLLVRGNMGLALWAGADLVVLAGVWGRGTVDWSRVAPAWDLVAAYVAVRGALLALGVTIRIVGPAGLVAHTAAARGVRLLTLGGALLAPALVPLAKASPLWQSAVTGGLLALLALGLCARAGEARDTWVGLAGVVAGPALALGGSALLLGAEALPLAAPLALTALLPALGLATLATPAALAPPSPD